MDDDLFEVFVSQQEITRTDCRQSESSPREKLTREKVAVNTAVPVTSELTEWREKLGPALFHITFSATLADDTHSRWKLTEFAQQLAKRQDVRHFESEVEGGEHAEKCNGHLSVAIDQEPRSREYLANASESDRMEIAPGQISFYPSFCIDAGTWHSAINFFK